jgi:hypothetical protein
MITAGRSVRVAGDDALEAGEEGLRDRSSAPFHPPNATKAEVVDKITSKAFPEVAEVQADGPCTGIGDML